MKKRIIATILSIALMITQVPWTALDVFAQTTLDVVPGSKVSDADTTDGWETYFGTDDSGNVSTEFAGAVWADKSVFAGSKEFDDIQGGDSVTLAPGTDNFLVAMSAMSSTKQITGFSYLPTDTVLTLDLSGSMSDDDLKAMVQAANEAIRKLYETSNYNRVGIAVYNLNSYTLMPIDRYTTTDRNGDYLKFRKSGSTRYIDVADGVKSSNGNNYVNSVTGRSGTYTQGGMQEGLELLLDIEDTTIETGNIQGGTKRIPVMVLMTDGDPTSGTSNYLEATNANRNIGRDNYAETTDEIVFLAQLTAANVRTQMEAHYGRECLFYTLGLGVSGNYAPQMLQPQTTGTTVATAIDTHWRNYANASTGGRVATYTGTYNRQTINVNITRRTDTETGNKLVANRYYTDRYFSANNSQGLIDAFAEIIQEIILQSQYYPTFVTTGQYDMDGYVTIVDELGEYMEVKEIKGLLYNDVLYTGANLIAGMNNGTYGNAATWTELGWELVYSIRERLDVAATGDNTDNDTTEYGTPIAVTNDVVISLLSQAWQDGQIGGTYNSSTGTVSDFSNYISYYVNAKGQYLGFHDKDHKQTDWPVGTKYIGRSYIFSGNVTGQSSSIANAEMMHIVVQVYEDVTTGHQTVTYRVPASIIPTALYEVSVNGDHLDSSTVKSVEYTGDVPIRLVYEVGLNDELTPINIVEKLSAEGAHAHPTEDGGYYFYSNRWGNGHGVTELDPNNHKAAVAHYNPSAENERYYFTEDTILYIKAGDSYVPYTGQARPTDMYPNDATDSGYYRAYHIVSGTASNAGLSTKYIPVGADVLGNENETKQAEDGTWYVAKGTIIKQVARLSVEKEQNITETLNYVDYPVIDHPANSNANNSDYEVFNFLGNNGRLKVMPATGIKVTKTVAEFSAEDNAVNEFGFVVTLTGKYGVPADMKVIDADGNEIAHSTGADSNGLNIYFKLEDGQTAYITGLDGDTSYTVREESNLYYKVQSVTAETVTDGVAGGVTTANQIDAVEFVNTASSFKGNLQVSKTVTHPYGADYVIPDDKVFHVVIDLSEQGVYSQSFNVQGTVKEKDENGEWETVELNGPMTPGDDAKFEFDMGHDDSVTIYGLPHGATYEVTETALPTGFTNTSSTGLTGTIVTDQTAYANLVNNYKATMPKSTEIDLFVTKNFNSWDKVADDDVFQFVLEKYEPTTQSWVDTGRYLAVSKNTTDHKIALYGHDTNVEFSYIGTHYYRLTEKPDTIDVEGITYDATHAYFMVIVEDDEMDGVADYTVKAANNIDRIDEKHDDATDSAKITGYDVYASFNNYYDSTTANINIHKNLTNTHGVDIPMSEFSFGLYTKDENDTLVPVKDANNNDIVVTPNVNGDVIIPVTYQSTDSRFVADGEPTEVSYDAESEKDANIALVDEKYIKTSEIEASYSQKYKFTDVYYLKEIVPDTDNRRPGMEYSTAEIKVEVTVNKTVTTTYKATKTVVVTSSEETPNIGNPDEWTADETTAAYSEKTGTRTEKVTSLTNSVKYFDNTTELTAAIFNNRYDANPAKTTIVGEKTYNRNMTAGQFTFNLYETDSTFALAANAQVKDTATVDAVSTISGVATDAFGFAEITYDKVGTYYYVVKEAMPAGATAANNYTVDGITYDQKEYHVTVVVSLQDNTNNLVASTPVINQVGGSNTSIKFNNTYSITQGTSAALQINKALTGRALNSGEFTFYLYEKADYTANGENATKLQTVTNSAYNNVNGSTYTGTVVFEAIPYNAEGTYEYVIVEDTATAKGGITYDATPYVYATVTVADNGKGELYVPEDGITYTENATISNTYTTEDATMTKIGIKYFVDNADNSNKDTNEVFVFGLYKADRSYTQGDLIATINGVKTSAGVYHIPISQRYTTPGDYFYVLREIPGNTPTVSYDSKVYHISVVVTDDGVGKLNAITRIYLNGADVTDEFGLNAQGNPNGNVAYDFQNIYYKQEINATAHVNKKVENSTGVQLDKAGFRFGLYDTLAKAQAKGNDYIYTDLTDSEGNAYISVKFTDADVPNNVSTTKSYYISEMYADRNDDYVADTIGGMQYDDTIYRVTFEIGFDASKKLTAGVSLMEKLEADGTTWTTVGTASTEKVAEYTNKYDLEEAELNIPVEKKLDGRTLKDNEFSFALYNATVDSQGNWTKGTQVDTAKNVGGTVSFEKLVYSTIGTFHYIVEETIPADAAKLNGVTYDTAQYRITVEVTDNNTNKLNAAITEIKEINGTASSTAEKVVFENKFTPTPVEAVIEGVKKLNNRAPLEGEFEFALYETGSDYKVTKDAAGNITQTAIATVENAADGTFKFTNTTNGLAGKLYFTDAATKYFVVKEIVPVNADPTITYSKFEHNIEVKVTKSSEGVLSVSVKDTSGATDNLVIENTYTSKNVSTTINIEKKLTNDTGVNPGVTVKDFKFGLYTNEACTVPYTRNGHHVTVSPDDAGNLDTAAIILNYTDASYTASTATGHKFVYYLKEIIPAAASRVPMMKYDNSVYKVEVTLSYNNDNDLVATQVMTKVKDANGATVSEAATMAAFDNVYDLGSTAITLEGTKVYEGWTHDDEVFKFELYQTGASGNYAAAGSQLIGTATVDETNPNFTFTSENATPENTDNAAPQLNFTKAGTYYFAVRENQGGLTNLNKEIIYSGTQYVAAVKVSENVVNGKVTGLKAEKVVYHYGNKPEGLDSAESFAGFASDNIRFTNIDLKGEATVDFIGVKDITDAQMSQYDQAFDFVLYEATVSGNTWTLVDSKPDTTAVDPLLSTENREDEGQQVNKGYNIEFVGVPLEYTGDGSHTYHFVVKELDGGHPTIGYDNDEYRITVTAAFKTETGADGSVSHPYTVTSVVVNGKVTSFTTTNTGANTTGKAIVLVKGENNNKAFENTYTSYNATAEIPVEKVLRNSTGAAMGEDGFVFGVYTDEACNTPYNKANGEQVTATTGSDGKATISLDYTDKDVSVTPYVYYIKEIVPANAVPGMTYSQQVYKVEVTVAFARKTDGTGYELKATPVISTVDTAARLIVNRAEFTNTYALGSATLPLDGTKVIEDHLIYSYDFRFELYEAEKDPANGLIDGTVWPKGRRIEEVANTFKSGANPEDYDEFRFTDLTFDKAGTYHYIITERAGVVGGVIYDKSAYQITVTVAPHASEAKLVATITDIDKVVNDKDGNFVSLDEEKQTNVEFTADDVVFTNDYTPVGKFAVTGEKEITKRDWKNGDSFTFELYTADSNWVIDNTIAPLTQTVSYNEQGDYSFTFEDVIISGVEVDADKVAQMGTHYFVLKESAVDTNATAVKADSTEYRITVNSMDNGNGTLKIGRYDAATNVIVEDEYLVTKADGSEATEIVFVNEYITKDAVTSISGEKELTGRDIKDGEFTFELYKANVDGQSNWTIDTTVAPITTTNTGNAFEFTNVAFDQAGTYYFIVKEQKGANPAIKYSNQEFYVKVVVEDKGVVNGEAVLEVTSQTVEGFNSEIKFQNSYNPTDVTINIKKALSFTNGATHTLGGFKFRIEGVGNNTLIEATSGNDGTIAVPFSYTEKDLDTANGYAPKTYTYKVTEIDTNIDRMEYDDREYIIEVTLYAENGELKTTIKQNGTAVNKAEVQFNNTYKGVEIVPDNPVDPGRIVNTGDIRNNMLYAGLMAASAAGLIAVLFLMKKKKDEEDEAEA